MISQRVTVSLFGYSCTTTLHCFCTTHTHTRTLLLLFLLTLALFPCLLHLLPFFSPPSSPPSPPPPLSVSLNLVLHRLLSNEGPVFDDGLDHFVLVDGVPVAPKAKLPVLEKVLRSKVFKDFKLKNVTLAADPETGNGIGAAYLEFARAHDASECCEKMNNFKLDKKHTLKVLPLSKFNQVLETDEELTLDLPEMGNVEVRTQPMFPTLQALTPQAANYSLSITMQPLSIPNLLALLSAPVLSTLCSKWHTPHTPTPHTPTLTHATFAGECITLQDSLTSFMLEPNACDQFLIHTDPSVSICKNRGPQRTVIEQREVCTILFVFVCMFA